MIQINNGFSSCYYFDDEGNIYNNQTGKILKSSNNIYTLKLEDNKNIKKISYKKLYQLVFNKTYCKDEIEDLKDEIWVPIEGNENLYISNMGRLKTYSFYTARLNKVSFAKYCRTYIKLNGKYSNVLIHRLVAKYFLPDYEEEKEVHHINFNPLDNRAENLRCVSREEHIRLHSENNRE